MDDKLYSLMKKKWNIISEGLIKLPTIVINKWVDDNISEIVEKIEETYNKGYDTYIDQHIIFQNPYNNTQEDITVNIRKVLTSVNENIETALYFDSNEQSIYISALVMIDRLKTEAKIKSFIKNGILHELTHVVDPGREFKHQQHDSYENYINSDIEFPAFAQQYVNLIKTKSNNEKEKIINSIRTGSKFHIKEINDWYNQLNEKNKKKFINILVQELR